METENNEMAKSLAWNDANRFTKKSINETMMPKIEVKSAIWYIATPFM
jgi:hypothetical protein